MTSSTKATKAASTPIANTLDATGDTRIIGLRRLRNTCMLGVLALAVSWPVVAAEKESGVGDGAQPEVAKETSVENGVGDHFPDHIEQILKEDKNAKTLADAPRCVSVHRIRNTQVIDKKRIAFKMGRGAYYLVQLETECLGLKKGATISYAVSGQRLCKQDGIHAMVDFGPSSRLGPRCAIAGFVPVTKDYLDMLKDQLAHK